MISLGLLLLRLGRDMKFKLFSIYKTLSLHGVTMVIITIVCFLWKLKPGIRGLERREEVAQGAGVSRALAVNRGGAEVFNRGGAAGVRL